MKIFGVIFNAWMKQSMSIKLELSCNDIKDVAKTMTKYCENQVSKDKELKGHLTSIRLELIAKVLVLYP